jgi:hypothetical protein
MRKLLSAIALSIPLATAGCATSTENPEEKKGLPIAREFYQIYDTTEDDRIQDSILVSAYTDNKDHITENNLVQRASKILDIDLETANEYIKLQRKFYRDLMQYKKVGYTYDGENRFLHRASDSLDRLEEFHKSFNKNPNLSQRYEAIREEFFF